MKRLEPEWNASQHYDPVGSLMYYASGNRLRKVGFDGTDSLGTLEVLEILDPDWTGLLIVIQPDGPPAGHARSDL